MSGRAKAHGGQRDGVIREIIERLDSRLELVDGHDGGMILRNAGKSALQTRPRTDEHEAYLKILANAWKIDDRRDAERVDDRGATNARELQQLRSLNRPGAEDHFAGGALPGKSYQLDPLAKTPRDSRLRERGHLCR
jgi:hypothetical protein